ncbi:MAG: glycoside hydrolase family 28 protein, partial [Clostridia bacterium]
FSVFNLIPATKYILDVEEEHIEFTTSDESQALNVADFGAVGDGEKDDTMAIQMAIDCVKDNGRVIVPKGIYFCAPLTLRSNITLDIQGGATILGHTCKDDYPIMPGEIKDALTHKDIQIGTWEGEPRSAYKSLISGFNIANTNIVGEGVIDGNAQNGVWWVNHKQQTIGRPRLVFLNNCNNITMHGVSGQNSASWQLHPFFSQNINFLDVKINAPADSPNTDGCDPESCDSVNIIGCVFSVGDDCVAIKSGKVYMGAKYKTPASRHIIRNCLMQYGHGAVVLGSEMAGGVKELSVTQCLFNRTDRGLRIKTRRGRGKDAVIDDITFENIRMEKVLTPLVINMYYFCDFDGKSDYVQTRVAQNVDDSTPYLGRFTFKDIECVDCEVACGYFDGLTEQPIKEVTIDNVVFSMNKDARPNVPAMLCNVPQMCKSGLYFDNVGKLTLKNIKVNGVVGEEIIIKNVKQVVKE